ncbi:L10-interacting MYB domain-containing protein-like [Argentina anserina]|uniref:L10-interacting MYB domain-containing protein-like n=1 Tax=Argentina anserina TaxID=57926 RepID=UPI0021765332|nr:L10-interacting MYB domain-containing protein-like [Potentilla anserina]
MAGHVTRSRVQPQLQEQQLRARWTTHLTKILASLMVDQVHQGNRKNDNFSTKSWKYICDEFYKKTGLKWDKEQLKNRYAVMRKMYVIIKSLLDRSDFSWDEATGTITASDEVWAEYMKEHAEAENLRSNGCPIFKELCIIFSEPATNGKHGHPAEHEEPIQQVILSSSESEEADKAVEDKETGQPITPSTTAIRKRGRKGVDDAIAGAILKMAAASKLRTAAVQHRAARYTIANCIKVLDQITGVDEQVYFAAVDLFDNPIAREMFLSLKHDKRLIWLQGKCRAANLVP